MNNHRHFINLNIEIGSKMKKTFTITSILGLLASSNSFAKTSGNYAAINFIGTKIESSGTQAEIEEDMSFGVDYKYALTKRDSLSLRGFSMTIIATQTQIII